MEYFKLATVDKVYFSDEFIFPAQTAQVCIVFKVTV